MIRTYFQKTTHAAPLSLFRMVFGLLLFGSIVRFWLKGWIHDLYIKPKYFFSFYGFEFVKSPGEFTYLIFAICAMSALLFAVGYRYRIASICLFLSFTYIELIDKSTYLNHYYFVSMVCLLMIFLPANAYFSVDAYRSARLNAERIPKWTIDALKLFVCLLYFYAGLAKINSDWLIEAQPLKIWLPAKNDIPVIGFLFNYTWVAYAFCWLGCLYDLSIPFLLTRKSTRVFAYAAVVIFHLLTSLLFPIGMFPYIMIATAVIFLSADVHQSVLSNLGSLLKLSDNVLTPRREYAYTPLTSRIVLSVFALFFAFQVTMPFRYLLYPGELFWTEEGYRFSWRVMLIEKAGYAQFTVKDATGRIAVVDNRDFLTSLQEKMMSTQPDMILQYAHALRDHFTNEGFQSPEVYVDSYVTVNGRLGRPLVDPSVDLTKLKESFTHKRWLLTFNDEIEGF
jgi:hypothetical protein